MVSPKNSEVSVSSVPMDSDIPELKDMNTSGKGSVPGKPVDGSSSSQIFEDIETHRPVSLPPKHRNEGQIRFVNLIVRRPCFVALTTLTLLVVCLLGLGSVILQEGSAIISEEDGDDLNDIRTRRRDALILAREELGLKNDEASVKAATQTQSGDVLLLVFEAREGGDVFTESAIRRMREIEDEITSNPRFPEFCLRADKSGNANTCRAPLSPTRLFYAAGLNVAETLQKIDALDGSADGELAVFQMKNLTTILQEVQRVMESSPKLGGGQSGTMIQVGTGANNMMALAQTIAKKVGATQSAVLQAATLFQHLLPIMAALSGVVPVQEQMQDHRAVLQLAAAMKEVTFFKGYVDFYFDKGFESRHLQSKHTRATIQFGLPLEGYESRADRREEQDMKLSSWFQGSFRSFLQDIRSSDTEEMKVLYFASPLFFDEFISILLQDMMFALIAVVFVFLCVWFHTGSFFLAAVGMVEIVLSIPLAFVIYRTVFGFQYFAAINSMTLFVVLAIGADDIFVIMDAYQQSLLNESLCTSLQTRMTWVYRRSAGAMFVTSLTTMAAFIASGSSTLVDVQSFGIFAAFVIFVDFCLVITWFPACLVWYHNNLESRSCCCRRILVDNSTERARKMWQDPQDGKPVQQKRWVEQILGGPLASFVVKRRALILGFFAIVSACGGAGGAQIRPATSSDQFLPSDHPFQRIFDIMNGEFPSSSQDENAKVYLNWGLEDVDRSGVNLLRDVTNKGSVVYDEGFRFDEAAQLHILKVCEEVYQYRSSVSGFLSADPEADVLAGKVDCPLFDLKAWLEDQGKPFPVPFDEVGSTLVDFLGAPVPDAEDASQTFDQKWTRYLGFSRAMGQLRFITIGVESTLRDTGRDTHDTLEVQYSFFEDWVETLNRQAPRSADGAFHTAANFMWVWMHTQTVFVSSAVTGMISGSVLAFVVVLLATQQILVAFASFLTILGVLTSVLGSMVALGWELGTIESICLTILAGFSVDYVVHLAHAFVHADKKDRSDKVQTALDEIGISVLFGMFTSASAAFALIACQIQFFHKFGVFLLMTVSMSWVWANLGFMASMAVFGPDDETPSWLQFPASMIRSMTLKKAVQMQKSAKAESQACQMIGNSQQNGLEVVSV